MKGRILIFTISMILITEIFFPSLSLSQLGSTRISKISVEGNVRSNESLIVSASGLRHGQYVTREDIRDAIRDLYALGLFHDIKVLKEEDENGETVLTLEVKEYPALKELRFEGNDKIKDKDLEKTVGFIKEQVISPKDLKDAEIKIRSMYEDKGYLLAEVDHNLFKSGELGEIILGFNIREGVKVQVKRIGIFGNEKINDSDISKQMETKEDRWWRGGDFKRDVYREDLRKIEIFYRSNGYRDAEILRDSLYYDGTREGLYIDIYVQEGTLYRFGEVTWEGNTFISNDEISKQVVAKRGQSYEEFKYLMTRQNISSAYQETGYLNIRVIPEIVDLEGKVNIHFKILEGNPSRVKIVKIKGNTKTKEKVIRRELSVKPGQVFRRSELERSVRDIYILGYFKNVEPKHEVLENGDVNIEFDVEERHTGTASMGAGFSERDRLVGTIGLSVPNFLGNGQKLDFNWDFGTRRELLRIGFTEPWLFDTPTSGSFNIFKSKRQFFSNGIDEFDLKRQGVSVSMGRKLGWPDSFSRGVIRYRFEEERFGNFSAEYTGTFKDRKPTKTATLSATYIRDSRDLPLFPTKGSIVSYTPEFGGEFLGGDADYYKHFLDGNFFFGTLWKFVLNVRTRVGFVKTFADDIDNIPFTEKFTPGGIDIVDGMIRGYSDRSVGPREDGFRQGGNSMLIFNIEYRFPVVDQQMYGIFFADAGNAWKHPSDLDIGSLKRSAGFGIRFMAPIIGLIGFDFAYGFDREEVDGALPEWKTHFQFGPQLQY